MTVDATLRCRRVSSAALIGVTMAFAAGCSSNNGGSSSSGSSTGRTTATTSTGSTGTHGSSSSSSSGSTGTHGSSASSTSGSTGSTGSTGSSGSSGSSGSGGTIGSGVVANGGFTSPFDAAPAPATGKVYFTALDNNGVGQVFSVTPPATTVTTIANAGTQFVAPAGVALSADGLTLYVADPAANTGSDDRGCILMLATAGGSASCVSGTGAYQPTAIAVGTQSGADTIYFIGIDSSGLRDVFQIPSGGGTANSLNSTVYKNPIGIASDNAGNQFIIDNDRGQYSTLIESPAAGGDVVLASNLKVGFPAGIGTDATGSNVFVAAIDPATGKDAIAKIAVATPGAVTYSANNGINAFGEPAGLKQAGGFTAYVDASANGGSVFLVTP
jgi:hypothetical protein